MLSFGTMFFFNLSLSVRTEILGTEVFFCYLASSIPSTESGFDLNTK